MPDVSSLLSSGKAERENEAFPRPCLDGVVLGGRGERAQMSSTVDCHHETQISASLLAAGDVAEDGRVFLHV